jgi:hypothetical protein
MREEFVAYCLAFFAASGFQINAVFLSSYYYFFSSYSLSNSAYFLPSIVLKSQVPSFFIPQIGL